MAEYDTAMTSAFVTTNILDMRAKPEFHSERVNQLLFGDIVSTGTRRKGYNHVVKSDGYRGWVDNRFLKSIPDRQADKYIKEVNWVLAARQAQLLNSHRRSEAPHLIYYGTRIRGRSLRGSLTELNLPDNTVRLVKTSLLRPINRENEYKVEGRALVREAMKFLGVPYLWGGISPLGFDCSGLVQTVCLRFGIDMPRDTSQQIKVGKLVPRSETKGGDLLFFRRHVGFAIDDHKLVHASVGGAGVRVNSLRQGDPDYRADLDLDFQQARRIV